MSAIYGLDSNCARDCEVRAGMSSQRSGVLELAILGILHETPMHGYELRKRLNSLLGAFRAFGYGSLYPALKDLLGKALIAQDAAAESVTGRPLDRPRRSKIVYRLTADGKERLNDLLGQSGPASWEDDGFGVHFAFFGLTQAEVRMRILEGRRSRLEERLEGFRAAATRTRERVDSYTLELQRHGLESVEREVRWLNELIASERQSGTGPGGTQRTPPGETPQSGGATTVV
jgi:DNA-binding PadR family transcriptional regulator